MNARSIVPHPRAGIYYWKCDRPATFHGTIEARCPEVCLAPLQEALSERFANSTVTLRPAGGQGNHITFIADIDGVDYFVRVEDGPEHDDYIEVESFILGAVRSIGLPAPRVLAVDASRFKVPFAWQVMEKVDAPDLNEVLKKGALNLPETAEKIGRTIAQWQTIQPEGYGPFNPEILRSDERLQGFHAEYADYFFLHLDRHLDMLTVRSFLDHADAEKIRTAIETHCDLLNLESGCLVHKDLALWNILGTADEILAFIDWDDSISGDPMDDLSLLGCFHDGDVLARALRGYAAVRPLPPEYRRRFWLHLLRNMIVKAVIRVGAGYFDRDSSFFLIGSGSTGASLKTETHARLMKAVDGLNNNQEIETI
ncbi:MAG: aminoglycoside phosphotransferase family protein [Kiritimatiellales bacterium]|nr:aminoglycoside phosphotransferase family protein [Kiritimatiellales bacterium]